MTFTSADEVARAFGLEGLDRAEVRRRLRERQAELHPDRHEGDWESPEAEVEFHRISSAMRVLDAPDEAAAMVPIEAIPQLVRVVRDALTPEMQGSRREILAESLDAQLDRNTERYRPPLAGPRFTMTGVSAALSAVWVFPGLIAESPVLSRLLDTSSVWFMQAWASALILTGGAWFIAWRQQETHREIMSALRSEVHQNRIFRAFIRQVGVGRQRLSFSKDDLVHFVRRSPIEFGDFRRPSLFLPPPFHMLVRPAPIDHQTAQSVADLLIARLESRSIITQVPTPSLSATYRIAAELGE